MKKFALNFEMKQYSTRYHWFVKIGSAVVAYLSSIVPPALLKKPFELLKKVKKNLPVYSLVGFALYFTTFVWKWKLATRTDDVEVMNFMWRYSFVVYGPTQKKNYRKVCLQMGKVLYDSTEAVTDASTRCRTVLETGRLSTGCAYDFRMEHVSHSDYFACLSN